MISSLHADKNLKLEWKLLSLRLATQILITEMCQLCKEVIYIPVSQVWSDLQIPKSTSWIHTDRKEIFPPTPSL